VDSSVFEHFVFRLLEYVRGREEFQGRPVVLLMDNATIHKHPQVLDVALRMKVILMFNPQYSPQLNPVERYFKWLKREVQQRQAQSR